MHDTLPATLRALLFPVLWAGWAGYWFWTARDTKAAMHRETLISRGLHLGPQLLAAALLSLPPWLPPRLAPLRGLWRPVWPPTEAGFWVGAMLAVAGVAFAVWARRHIGRNWSAVVTLKHAHELITSGPYARVRHPIYTGLLVAVAGTALAQGQWRSVLATAIVLVTILGKLRIEERFMRQRFGAQYDDYARRVKALVPGVY